MKTRISAPVLFTKKFIFIDATKMKVTVIILMAISIILLSQLVESSPTPKPMFPFTTLPKKGEGHRKIAGLKRKGWILIT